MASPAAVPAEQASSKPSFAKVAAAALAPRPSKEAAPKARPPVATPRNLALPQVKRPTPAKAEAGKAVLSKETPKAVTASVEAPKVATANPEALPVVTATAEASKAITATAEAPELVAMNTEAPNGVMANADHGQSDDKVGTAAARTGAWTDTAIQSAAPSSDIKADGSEKPQPVALVKVSAAEDSGTQLSSSDGSGKPPSIDGKSVASATTFALDEKESLRPDDSASLRAVEEEDVTSPPESIMADSRQGSDNGAARAFRDQLHEIAVMTGHPHRGGPPVRFPNVLNGAQGLYDPNQPPNGAGVMSPPVVNGMPQMNGESSESIQPDPRLLELNPRDRLFIAKIETDFIDFIKESRESVLDLPNCNAFYRMLAHRLAEYYGLNHDTDTTMNTVKVTRTPRSRIPPPVSQMGENNKGASTPPVEVPARVILRRDDGRSSNNTTSNSQNPSKPTSEIDGSEDGQDGNHKGKSKANMTREEREARYKERRAHIFGQDESGENETTEGSGSGEEKAKETSRSSSAAGKRKNGRKPRNDDDDDFQARSHYNVYYPPQYSVSGYGSENAVYYSAVGSTVPGSPYSSMNSGPTPPHYGNPYPMMSSPAPQVQYGWPGQQYQPPPGPSMYPGYGPIQNGYDLSGDFQRGMSSFQNAGNPSQATPRMGNVPMASFPNSPQQPHNVPMNPGWSPMPQQQAYPPMAPGLYAPTTSGDRPTSAPQQRPLNDPYPYGHLPTAPYNFGSNNNQHPIPGSYNRQQFNPQSQAFIPGVRSGPFPGQTMVGPNPQHNSGQYNYSGPQVGINNNYQVAPFSSPGSRNPSFGSPQSMQGNGSSAAMHRNMSQPGPASSIAKYGTPSHLPAKPPAPAVVSKQPDHLPGAVRLPENGI